MKKLLFILLTVIAFGPFIFTVLFVNQVEKAPEFVYYRIGDALSLAYGEAEFVRPVQGLPTALLSKAVVAVTPDITNNIKTYSLLWGFGLLIPLLASFVCAWRLNPTVALTQSVILTFPWLLGTSVIGLMIAPEYWQGEWAYLAITFALLAAPPFKHAHLIAGIWSAIGISIKITMAPVFLLLLLFINDWRAKKLLVALISCLIAYIVIALLYMGSFTQTYELLKFQALFFISPNGSQSYGTFAQAVVDNKPLIALLFVVIALSFRNRIGWLILAWTALHLFVVSNRLHGSSVTSLGIFLGFALCVLITDAKRMWFLAVALLVVTIPALYDNFQPVRTLYNMRYPNQTTNTDFFNGCEKVTWYLDSNHWNIATPVQGFGYNGQLAMRPDGAGKTFAAIFPNTKLVAAPLPRTEKTIKENISDGYAIYWTRPVNADTKFLMKTLGLITVQEIPGNGRYSHFVFGRAFSAKASCAYSPGK